MEQLAIRRNGKTRSSNVLYVEFDWFEVKSDVESYGYGYNVSSEPRASNTVVVTNCRSLIAY
jgi:hypothetical protein